jgi:RNA polymerase sigma-70 factor (ECF subfamily)
LPTSEISQYRINFIVGKKFGHRGKGLQSKSKEGRKKVAKSRGRANIKGMANESPRLSPVEEVQRLFLRHRSVLRGFILGLMPDPNRAEDIFQEVFLTVTRKASDYEPGTNFLAWARSIARLKVLEACRSHRGGPALLEPEAIDALAHAAEEQTEDWDQRRVLLADCLEKLAPRAREIVEMRYSVEQLSPPTIAQRLSWSVNAVHVALSRARKFLQECTRRRLSLEDPAS